MTATTTAPPEQEEQTQQEGPAGLERKHVLDLDTLEVQETVTFEDVDYPLRNLERDFGLADQHRLKNEGLEYQKLWENPGKLKAKEYTRLETVLNNIFDAALDAPDDVKKKIGPGGRQEVLTTFMLAPLRRAARQRVKDQEAEEQKARESSTTAS